MGLNLTSPTTFTGLFVAPTIQAPGGSNDAIPTPSTAVSPGSGLTLPVSAICELGGNLGALLIPRMTTTQKNALDNSTSTVANGMVVYDTTLNEFSFYQGAAWVSLGGGGTGTVIGPVSSTNTALVRWNGTTGINIEDSVVTLDNNGVMSGATVIDVKGFSGNGGQVAFFNSANTHSTTLIAGANTADLLLDLPIADATVSGNPLVSNASGVLSFNPSAAFGTVASLVNYVSINGSATGNPVQFVATGTDGNIGIQLSPKGTGSLENAVGAIATPSYSFVGRLDTGMWSSAAATLDFSTTGGRQFQIIDSATAVNWGAVTGAPTGSAPIFEALGTDGNIDLDFKAKGTGSLAVLGTGTVGGGMKFYNTANSHFVQFSAGALTTNPAFVWPIVDATTPGAPLVSDAAGNLSFNNSGMLYATVTLNTAAITGMFATPQLIISAPGASKAIIVHRWMTNGIGAGSGFGGGGSGSGVLTLGYSTAADHASAATIKEDVVLNINVGLNQIDGAGGFVGSAALASNSQVVNQPLYITNSVGAFTGGGTSTLVVDVWYSIVSAS